jgi:hypothetical protein
VVLMNFKKQSSNYVECFPKTLFAPSLCKITKNDGFGDLLSQSDMRVDDQDEEILEVQHQRRGENIDAFVDWVSFTLIGKMTVTP